MLTAAPGSDDSPQAISQPRTSAPAEEHGPGLLGPPALQTKTTTAPQWPVGIPRHGAATARQTTTPEPIVQPSWRRTLHRISRSSTIRGDPDEHIDRGPQQAPRPGARQAHRPGSSADFASSHRTTAETPLPVGFLFLSSKFGRLVTCTAAGPGSPPCARPELLGLTTQSSRPAGRAGPLTGHPTALRWGYHGVQFPRAVHSQTTLVGGGERKFD